jgi:hypothetical protein
MVFAPVRLPAVVCAACVLGCSASAPSPSISAITPMRGYSDRPVRLMIQGKGFLPTFQIDQAAGQRRGEVSRFRGQVGTNTQPVLLRDFDWLDMDMLSATMDPGLPPGLHDLVLIDPRGQPARLKDAFWSLGADVSAPTVTFEKPLPATPVAGGTVLDVAIAASDADPGVLGSLHWEAWAAGGKVQSEDCRLQPNHSQGRCDFQVVVPVWLVPGAEFLLRAVAVDSATASNRTEQSLSLIVQSAPTVAAVSPTRGGIVGGTDLVITGSGFVMGSQVSIGGVLMLPHGGVVVDAQTIFGRAPAHGEGLATIVVRTPIGEAKLRDAFLFAPPPKIEAILPEVGDPDGATVVRVRGRGFTSQTQIFFGDTLVAAEPCEEQTFISETEISGAAPAGRGRTSVWAFDAALGWTRLTDGFGWMAP